VCVRKSSLEQTVLFTYLPILYMPYLGFQWRDKNLMGLEQD